MIHYKIENIIDGLAEKLGSTALQESKFKQEYLLLDVTEEQLLEVGFEFDCYDITHTYPLYKMENLTAFFDNNVLHIYQAL